MIVLSKLSFHTGLNCELKAPQALSYADATVVAHEKTAGLTLYFVAHATLLKLP